MDTQKLVLSKYLFFKGQDALKENILFSPGHAISLFQDSVEILLWTISLHIDANVKPNQSFEGFWDVIRDAPGNPEKKDVPFKSNMISLNKEQVSFKHYGNLTSKVNAITFSDYTEEFLRECMRRFLSKDFDDVSLADLIEDLKIRELVKQAEQYLDEGNLKDCIVECAKADNLISDKMLLVVPSVDRNLGSNLFMLGHPADAQIQASFNYIKGYLENLRTVIAISWFNVNPGDCAQFKGIIPKVIKFDAGNFSVTSTRSTDNLTVENVSFCVRHVRDLALNVQSKI